jgi:hypothetical protein
VESDTRLQVDDWDKVYDAAQEAVAALNVEIPGWVVTVIVNATVAAIEGRRG